MTKGKIKFGTDGWRAIIAEDFTFQNLRFVSKAVANHINKQEKLKDKGLIVAYDNRFMAEEFAGQVAGVLVAAGIKVYITERATPTPATAFGVVHLQTAGALMLTASHNPAPYMGIKFIPHYAGPAMPEETDKIIAELEKVLSSGEVPFKDIEGMGADLVEKIDLKKDYLNHLNTVIDKDKITASSLKVVVDPMHGAGGGYIEEFLKGLCEVKAIRNNRDPLFGGSLPDPSQKYLALLGEEIKKNNAHLGMALDGDADRLGIIDSEGIFYSPNQILTLFLHYLVKDKGLKGKVARTVATTHMLDMIAKKHGLEVIETPVGFKYIGQALREEGAFIGGEESGGVSIRGHMPEKDGIMAGLLFAEMLATTRKTPKELFAEIKAEYGSLESRRLDIACKEDEKPAIVEKLKNWEPKTLAGQEVKEVNRIDGIKVLLENSWCLVRPSGTEAVFRVYLEGPGQEELDSLAEAVAKELEVH